MGGLEGPNRCDVFPKKTPGKNTSETGDVEVSSPSGFVHDGGTPEDGGHRAPAPDAPAHGPLPPPSDAVRSRHRALPIPSSRTRANLSGTCRQNTTPCDCPDACLRAEDPGNPACMRCPNRLRPAGAHPRRIVNPHTRIGLSPAAYCPVWSCQATPTRAAPRRSDPQEKSQATPRGLRAPAAVSAPTRRLSTDAPSQRRSQLGRAVSALGRRLSSAPFSTGHTSQPRSPNSRGGLKIPRRSQNWRAVSELAPPCSASAQCGPPLLRIGPLGSQR